jgi:hypothetical protein
MIRLGSMLLAGLLASAALSGGAEAEILALANYETKSEESLKALKLSGPQQREEGIAIIDVDPESDRFGQILMNIPLPADLVAHHIFYDRTQTKAYIAVLGQPVLITMDLTRFPYRLDWHDMPDCAVGEDVIFNEDNTRWYLTCMGSSTIVVGDVATDKIIDVIKTTAPYPHGLAVHSGINRILATNTVRASDLGDAGEVVSVYDATTHEALGVVKVSNKPSPSSEAPVEIVFKPGSQPPVAYVTNMFGGTLWALTWNAGTKEFDAAQVHDFGAQDMGVPLEIYFNDAGDRMFVTTGKPGHLHIFDVTGDPNHPKLLKSIAAGEGAHHVAITKDEKYGVINNALLNLPGLSDGTLTVVDLQKGEAVATIETFKEKGYNANSIVLLPEWNSLAGH